MMIDPKRPSPYRPDCWLIMSAHVHDEIVNCGAQPESLFALRQEANLVRRLEPAQLAGTLIELSRAGWQNIHLVFERIDDEAIALCRPLFAGDPDIQLHDWSDSPTDVLSSLNAPDQTVTDRLRSLKSSRPVAALALAELPDMPGFAQRQRAALRRWEEQARAEFGAHFDSLYSPQAIEWSELLVAQPALQPGDVPAAKPARAAAEVLAAGARLLGGVVRWVKPPLVPARGAFASAAAARASTAAPPIEWGPFDTGRGNITLRAQRVEDRGETSVELVATWEGGQPGNVGITLVFEEPRRFELPIARRWTKGAGEPVTAVAQRIVSDPVGALWTMLGELAAGGRQPELELDEGPSATA
jgi:hypothetical protein